VIHWSLQTSCCPGSTACGLGETSLTAAERARLVGFRVPKRRAEWLTGRITAKSVVARALGEVLPCDWPFDAIEIASAASGMPYARLAPEAAPVARFAPGERLPVTVSISHAEGHALCAATFVEAAEGRSRTIGIDLGLVEPRSSGFVATFFTSDEQRFVADAPPWERDLSANLIWCAKEAVLKALGVGLSVDTLALRCLPEAGVTDPAEWAIVPCGHEWRPFVATCGPALVPGGAAIRGVWCSFGGFAAALASHAAPSDRGSDRSLPAATAAVRSDPVEALRRE
jgi:4'-phosphopantetheinyl transferase